MKTIVTPRGEVVLNDPPVELLRTIRSFLPFGAFRYLPPQHGADFGLVMQCGERELYAVKQQPVDCDKQQACVSLEANRILIARSLSAYLRHGFSGLFMPCAYLRTKQAGSFESGIAYFGYPSADGCETLEYPFDESFDGRFGHGFTKMMTSFIQALQQSSRDTGITLSQPVGLDLRPRSLLGQIGFGFMVVGSEVVCLKTEVAPDRDPTWTVLRGTGIVEVFHLPSVPAAIEEDQLSLSKTPANAQSRD